MAGKPTHGKSKTPVYAVWAAMVARCTKPTNSLYRYYGARGITVCDRWRTFSNFFADMGDQPKGLTLDRKDNSGPYSPENCRWTTKAVQQRNKRDTRMFTFRGETKALRDWADHFGLNYQTVRARLRYGWAPERVFTEPITVRNRVY